MSHYRTKPPDQKLSTTAPTAPDTLVTQLDEQNTKD